MNKPIAFRVVVVEDHALFLRSLLAVIRSHVGLLLCGKAQDAECAIKLVAARNPDLAIIDITLKGDLDGIELTKRLKTSHPNLQILVISYHFEPEYEAEALAAGASAYWCKTAASTKLLDTLGRISIPRPPRVL